MVSLSTKRAQAETPLVTPICPSSIDRLPPELLIKIFHKYIQCVYPSSQSVALGTLSQVSRSWLANIRQAHTLWASISSNEPPDVCLRSVARSGTCPLEVKLVFSNDCEGEKDSFQLFLLIASGQVERWRSARFITQPGRTRQVFELLANVSAPIIEDLEVMVDLVGDWPIQEDLLGGKAPRLRHLTLGGVLIPWDSGLYSDLETLVLHSTELQAPTEPQLAEVLIACPSLVHLCLRFGERSNVPSILNVGAATIALSHLRSLELLLPMETIVPILARIRVPECRRLALENINTGTGRRMTVLSRDTTHLLPTISRILHDRSQLDQASRSNRVKAFIYHFVETLNFSLRTLGPLGLDIECGSEEPTLGSLFWILENLRPVPLIELTLHQIGFVHIQPLREILGRPYMNINVTMLALERASQQTIDALCDYLAEPYTATGLIQWHLPNLETLEFRACFKIQLLSLINMLRARSGWPSDPSAEKTKQLPMRISRVKFHRTQTSRGDIIQVQELVECDGWSEE